MDARLGLPAAARRIQRLGLGTRDVPELLSLGRLDRAEVGGCRRDGTGSRDRDRHGGDQRYAERRAHGAWGQTTPSGGQGSRVRGFEGPRVRGSEGSGTTGPDRIPKVSRPRLAACLDYLALLAFLGSVAIHSTGGFAVTIAGLPLSARRPERALVVALVALALRLLLDRERHRRRRRGDASGTASSIRSRMSPRKGARRIGLDAVRTSAARILRLWDRPSMGAGLAAGFDPGVRGPSLFGLARVVGLSATRWRSAELVRRQHFSSSPAHAHLLRFDALPGADGRAAARGRRAPGRCDQRDSGR